MTQVYMVAVIYARGFLESCPAATRRVSALGVRSLGRSGPWSRLPRRRAAWFLADAWRRGDPDVIADLSTLTLRRAGLRP
ncbi:hypothetical protein OG416_35545 (plasmid) [Streptomyces longwoodensis]|uniref:hypothetical protein n=1 Tax=Streptomyces longwoodensis TaxID=68231 RepID=UPI002F9176FC|nr:hypothetical protein OG416_35545 [Streptomyces longwoodensis]